MSSQAVRNQKVEMLARLQDNFIKIRDKYTMASYMTSLKHTDRTTINHIQSAQIALLVDLFLENETK